MEGSVFLGIEMDAMEGDGILLAEIDAESFISIRLFASQVEIAVASLYVVSHLVERQQQGNAIGTSRQCHEILAVSP